MLRNSIIYRRFSYARKRNTVNIHIISKLISIIIIFIIIVTYVQKTILPEIAGISQAKVKDIFYEAVNSTINEYYLKYKISNRLIASSYDNAGNLDSIVIDSIKANKLSTELSYLIDKKLKELNLKGLDLHFGFLTGIKAFSKIGPLIHVKYSHFNKVQTKVDSALSKNLSNRQTLILILKIKSLIDIRYSMTVKSLELNIEIPVSETILLN